MSRVIRSFSKFSSSLQDEVYTEYTEGFLKRISFPYKGKIVDGVIYEHEDEVYLIPISTIAAESFSAPEDDEDIENESQSNIDDNIEIEDNEE